MQSVLKLTAKVMMMYLKSSARFISRYATSLITLLQVVVLVSAVYMEPKEDWLVMLASAAGFVVLFMYLKVVQAVADIAGCGDKVPVPAKRFTTVDNDGVVSVENDRLQEMLLYVADVEDYLERKWQS